MFGKKAIAPLVVIVISLVLFVINLIELKNGKKFLIGTQKETELNNVVEKMPVANNI